MVTSLRNKLKLTDLIFLLAILCSLSFGQAQEIPFGHVVIDKDAIGHRQVGDIDGDGFNDIAAVNYPMLVWYEYPNWQKHIIVDISTFADYKTYRSCDMELADIDGDGDPDIIGRIGIPKNDREGINCWFENPRPKGSPTKGLWKRHDIGKNYYAKDLEVADLNGDGKLDVVSRASNAKLHIYLQEASLWKETVVDITHHDGMDVGDMDRDGDPDIVLNGYWIETPDNPVAGKWLKRDFDNKWYTQKTGAKGQWYDNNCKVAVADMNKDGYLDIVISQAEDKGYPVCWYEAPPDPKKGTWKEHVISHVDKCHSLKAADFDNDGDVDVLAGEMPNIPAEAPHPVLIFINQGNSLKWKQQVLADYGNYSAQVGDIDNDGDMDIIGLRNHNSAPIEMWRNKTSDNKLSLEDWTYIEVDNKRGKWGDWDEPKGLKYFGLAMADVTGDGYKDTVAGRYFYRNPGGDMTAKWERVTFDFNVDGMLFVDVDGDEFADVIGEALPDVFWLEAQDKQASSWKATKIGTLPKTGHVNGQGYALGQIIADGKPEILLSSGNGIYYFEIPEAPQEGNWPCTLIANQASEEGIGVGDIDGDGDVDITAGGGGKKKGEGMIVTWWQNPGNNEANWRGHKVGATMNFADRFAVADINGDGRLDIVVSEETGKTDAHLFWFEQPSDPTGENWKRHLIVKQYTMNSMDVGDMDRDGDTDIIVNEHRGDKRVQVWENDGRGNFTEHLVGQGKEGHLGARVADMDNDGDLDIISIAWDDYQYLHLWRNDSRKGEKR